MLSEILGSVQRRGGRGLFLDTEARADLEFMRMFGVDLTKVRYKAPDTVTEVFKMVREWMPKDADEVIHGVFLDSLAALSTNMEMTEEEGDKMGGRRAKEFSQEFRRTTRLIKSSGLLLVCSNQVRENMNAGSWGKKLISPGGKALEHYISLKLFFSSAQKIKKKKTVKGKEVTRVVGVEANIEVEKSSIWMPFRSAPVIIIFDYGVDDVQANLKWLKTFRGDKVYTVRGRKLSNSLDAAIAEVEEDNLEKRLREDVINQWEEVEEKFHEDRKTKRRFD
jgi:RecA/RadA recombinase